MSLDRLTSELAPGGVVSRAVLVGIGQDGAELRRWVRQGDLSRLRPGWFSLPGADPMVVRAVHSGGVVSCVSALEFRGAWRPLPRGVVHTRRSSYHQRQRSSLLVCQGRRDRPAPILAVDLIPEALLSASACLCPDDLVAVMDSLVHRRLLTSSDLRRLLAAEPDWVQRLVDRCAPAESGTESLVRFRLTSLGFHVRSQVWIGEYRADLLLGDWLVIEVDSAQHHTGVLSYQADRIRDRRLLGRGYVVMRLTWEDVHLRWDAVLEDIRALLRQGIHRRGLGQAS